MGFSYRKKCGLYVLNSVDFVVIASMGLQVIDISEKNRKSLPDNWCYGSCNTTLIPAVLIFNVFFINTNARGISYN